MPTTVTLLSVAKGLFFRFFATLTPEGGGTSESPINRGLMRSNRICPTKKAELRVSLPTNIKGLAKSLAICIIRLGCKLLN